MPQKHYIKGYNSQENLINFLIRKKIQSILKKKELQIYKQKTLGLFLKINGNNCHLETEMTIPNLENKLNFDRENSIVCCH